MVPIVGPISFQEIESWARLMRYELAPSEVVALRMLDTAYRKHVSEKTAGGMGTPENNSVADSLRDIAEQNARKADRGR